MRTRSLQSYRLRRRRLRHHHRLLKDDDGDIRVKVLDLSAGLQPIHFRHRYIHQDEVGFEFVGHRNRLIAILNLAHYLETEMIFHAGTH